jgi:hypothetical protein
MTIEFENPSQEPNQETRRGAKHGNASTEADATLRLIAGLPAPQGLEQRVHRRIGEARALGVSAQAGSVLAWPGSGAMGAGRDAGREWMRAAAAAAIAFVIAGGGWGVYRQVQPRQAGGVITVAPRGAQSGGLAGAGAMRTPQTIDGPVLKSPVVKGPAASHTVNGHATAASTQGKDAKKTAAQAAKP